VYVGTLEPRVVLTTFSHHVQAGPGPGAGSFIEEANTRLGFEDKENLEALEQSAVTGKIGGRIVEIVAEKRLPWEHSSKSQPNTNLWAKMALRSSRLASPLRRSDPVATQAGVLKACGHPSPAKASRGGNGGRTRMTLLAL
jgi:hypothetical protein